MVARLTRLLVLLLLVASPVLAGVPVYIPSTSAKNAGTVITVGVHGDATVIGGTDCGVQADSTNVAGSAMALAALRSPSATNPVTIEVTPGLYNECVAVNNITDLSLHLLPGAILHPTSTVAGGVLKVANADVVRNVDRFNLILDPGSIIQNDSFTAPEAAVQIGKENCNAGNVPTWGDVSISGGGTVIGHHDSIQWCGAVTAAVDLPRLTITNIHSIGGRDNIVKKGYSTDYLSGMDIRTITNYCETPTKTFLAAVGGVVQAGSGTGSLVLEAPDKFGVDNGYADRLVKFTDDGGADCGAANVCDGTKAVITDYVESTGTATFVNPTCAITTGCNYTIQAVAEASEYPCTVDWSTISSAVATGLWKVTGIHLNPLGASDPGNPLDSFTVRDSNISVHVNEAVVPDQVCGPSTDQGHIAGVLAYTSTAAPGDWGNIDIQADIDVNVNADQANITCAEPIAAVALTGDIEALSFKYRGHAVVNNSADPDENVYGITNDATGTPPTLVLGDTFIDVNNTVGSYTGTTATLLATTPGTIKVAGELSSPDLITLATGTEAVTSGYDELCISVPNGGGAAFTDTEVGLFPISNALVGAQVLGVGCACVGTCGTPPTSDFTDTAGSNTIADEVACAVPGGAIAYTDVSQDTQSNLTAGIDRLYVNEGTTRSGTATDDLLACVRYTTNRWVN